MCKTCDKQLYSNKDEVEWESSGFWSQNISAKLAFKSIWNSRNSRDKTPSEGECDGQSDQTFDEDVEQTCFQEKVDGHEAEIIEGYLLITSAEEQLEPGNASLSSELSSEQSSGYLTWEEEEEELLFDTYNVEPSSEGSSIGPETRELGSSSGDLYEGKLEAKGHHPSPVIKGRRPFFYLPIGDEPPSPPPPPPTAGVVESYELPSLLDDPDLYPVPKGLPSSVSSSTEEECFSSDAGSNPQGENPQGSPLEKSSVIKHPSGLSDAEENIQSRIIECLARARSRSTSINSGSFEAGLYRLESLIRESEGGETDLKKGHVRQFSRDKNFHKNENSEFMPHLRDTGTITDVCASDNIPEVEIISLVQEQIPCYRLRADVISEFSGYDNEGWTVPFPALKESEVEALSPEQAEGALAYFLLCGNRVSQMTRTYHDIEAVTRLLQEKEKDLELAARIGQQLLGRNKALEEKNSTLESELCVSSEKITQLRHDLIMKTDLLQIYTNDFDDSSAETTPTSLRHINVDLLQRKVQSLENENVNLRDEATQLASDTQNCEEKEKELVHDVIKQLNEANLQVNQLSEELSKKIEDNLRQQEEMTQLLAQVVDLQATTKRLTRENEELGSLVGVARECQQELTTELAELKEKYAEVLDLLHDTQEQLRRVQKKNFPGSRGSHMGGGSLFSSLHSGSDSIASELYSLSSGEEAPEKVDGAKSLSRVFDTVRLSGKLGSSLPPLGYNTGSSVYSTPTKQTNQAHSHLSTSFHSGGRFSPYFAGSGMSMGVSSGLPSLDSGAESDASFPTDSEDNYPASRSGVPGWPGTPDLDSCLRRLGPHDRNSLNYLPYGCRTPDSIMSTGSGKSGLSGYSNQDWKLPQKLQIVKPIEGSFTLHQWSRLATPHLGGLLEEREGIAMKGATNADLNLEVYSMSDLEEDEEEEEKEEKEREREEEELEEKQNFPGKQFMSTSGVFTYTNSTVLHPDEVTNLTSSLRPIQISALPSSSVATSLPPTPSHGPSQAPSRRGSTATFSTNVGIAKHLRERGFAGAATDTTMATTATPANSPDGSRPGSPEPYSYKLPGLDDLTKRFHAGASFLRRTFHWRDDPSTSSSPPGGPKINLVERVQALGVDRLVGLSELPRSVGGVVTSRPQSTPPLLHLSNLIRSSAKTCTSGTTWTGGISTVSTHGSVTSPPKIPSPGERRPQVPPGAPMGIPGHPGAGHLDSRLTQLKPGQRSDLGTVGSVGSRPRPSTLGTIPVGKKDEKIGTVGWTSLGRKGGLL